MWNPRRLVVVHGHRAVGGMQHRHPAFGIADGVDVSHDSVGQGGDLSRAEFNQIAALPIQPTGNEIRIRTEHEPGRLVPRGDAAQCDLVFALLQGDPFGSMHAILVEREFNPAEIPGLPDFEPTE